MKAIFRREFRMYFRTPIAYIFIGMFIAMCGYFFYYDNLARKSFEFGSVLAQMQSMFIFLIPILTMRLLSEERNSRTDQLLLTAPVSVRSVVLGKFAAATAIYGIALGVTLLYVYILGNHVEQLPYAKLFCNYLGIFLVGLAFISVGIFISSLTQNQASAAIVTFVVLRFLMILEEARSKVRSDFLLSVVESINITKWYTEFGMGVLSIPAIIYYLSFTAVFLLFTICMVDKRRWS